MKEIRSVHCMRFSRVFSGLCPILSLFVSLVSSLFLVFKNESMLEGSCIPLYGLDKQ
uniref:Transmembrane protein n=1 Tax=Physcomitrium patens TaxID=3218 RepID=A0A2K1IQP6_PHYPA|nr:hypothetical protein PHYPA_025724 [Physcomitrium patens]